MPRKKKTEEIKAPYKVADLQQFLDTSFSKFYEHWKHGEDNERRWMGKNFTPKQESEIRGQGRQPLSMSLARAKVQPIIGIQQSQRTQYNIIASSDPNDDVKAALAKLQVHSCERRSNFPNIETDCFISAVGIQVGVSKMDLDYTNIYPRVVVRQVDYRDFMWDANSKEFDINQDALWCCEIDKQYRKMINQKYGVEDKKVNETVTGNFMSFEGRDKLNYYISKNENGKEDYDVISLFNFYIKTPKKLYYVIFPDSEGLLGNQNVIDSKHKTREDAEKKLRELQLPYLLQGKDVEGSVEEKDVIGIDRYLFTYSRILEYEETDLEMFPYNVLFAVRFADQFCSFMELLKDSQKWFDRLIMQLDYALGKDNKTATALNVNALGEGETPTTALQKIEQGKTVLWKGVGKVLDSIESKGANPQWLNILEYLQTIMDETGGGKNFQQKSGANESGRKVNTMIAQGALMAKPIMDNLRRWKMLVGRNILWWLQHYETAEDVIKVQGGALSPQMIDLLTKNGIYAPSMLEDGAGSITINREDKELSYLKDSIFELEVTEENLSDNERHAEYAIALEQLKADPYFQQSLVFREYLIELSDMPPNLKNKMIAELKQIQQNMQQQTEAKRAFEKRGQDIEASKVIANAPQGTFA